MIQRTMTLLLMAFLFMKTNAQSPYFLLDPTISPNAKTIVFSYDGDLWKVSATGGLATRITAMAGEETLPRISPDGMWLAFTSNALGNRNIYVMPMTGGEIKQLTFHDGSDEVDSWSWDSKTIYFTSNRENRYSGYTVSKEGGTPKRLFGHYFHTVHNLAIRPNSNELFFNESWESKNFTNRKRYKGAYNPDIKSYDSKSGTYKEYTSYNGKDMWASFDRNGKLFFVSDQANGEYNLYTFENSIKTQLTSFKTSIGRPQASANGEAVVFSKDYQIFLYDVANKQTNIVPIQLGNKSTLDNHQDFDVMGNITYFSVSPDNKKLAFISRGELFVSDTKGKFIKQIPLKNKERIKEVHWLKDNNTVLFTRTVKGYTNLFTKTINSKEQEKQLTKDARNNLNLSLNADMTKAVYISGRDELRLLDLTDFRSEVLVKDEFWALYAPQPHFSPDGKYVVFTAYRNFENDVFTIRLSDKRVNNLTQTGVTETSPAWSPDGRYIYFASNLTKPSYPYGLQNPKIYSMALDKYEEPYVLDEFEKLFKEEEKEIETKDKKKDKKAETGRKKDEVPVRINKKGLMERLQRVSPSFGSQYNPVAHSKDKATYLFYVSDHDEGKMKLWKTTFEPFEEDKTEIVVDEKVQGYQIKVAKDQYYLLVKGAIHTLDIKGNKTEKIKISNTFRRNLSEEFHQMFYEAWAGFEENFYDKDFHGEDWQKLRDQYAQYLPYITKRSQLRLLFNDMLGELNTSHFGFYSNGKEESAFYKNATMHTGILFSNDDPYLVERILTDGPADITGMTLRKGDRLIKVNDQEIDEKLNRESYFVLPSRDKEMTLTFSRNDNPITIKVHPTSTNTARTLMYDEWMDANQNYVDQKSNKEVAYIHMKNMTGRELERFKREMVSEANERKALILDLRYNTGGNVHDEVLQFLSQKPYLKWKYREGKLAPQPNFGPAAKPIIVLINEQSLSDAEMTSAGFKELGLGTLIGTETYRWIVFTSGSGLVDGSFYRLPSWGCYTLDGKNLEKEGVQPDILVKETFKDRLDGNQPQLDRALQEISKQLN
ncbi:Putative exported tricorn protease [Croceitalea dokdonensis DOKDO 023]|uniref:Tricorn protease homolog n=1 Tax=Croceitalea dokdonensis DOKDO 023 TaxID=1300341 RepID=A0A0P7AT03_9FLAO|nr:S41 family peptidase [Croceitalea dokdonensis]KPM31093.1 Putative exported tricorn protease [Croceitalea dokdonensis DOKDO 023]